MAPDTLDARVTCPTCGPVLLRIPVTIERRGFSCVIHYDGEHMRSAIRVHLRQHGEEEDVD